MYKKILVGLDLESENDTPLITALRLAEQYEASVDIVSAIRPALLSPKGFFDVEFVDRQTIVKEAKAALDSRIAQYSRGQHATHVSVGKASEKIAQYAEHLHADLIVIGARTRSRSETILGTTATNILRIASGVDVYACHRPAPEKALEQIVVAIDGSEMTSDVLNHVAQLLETSLIKTKPSVRVVSVASPRRKHRDELADKCIHFLDASALRNRPFQVLTGDVVAGLDKLVKRFDTDLLVIGSGRNLGASWYVGSTTNNILHECACDVLVIRPDQL